MKLHAWGNQDPASKIILKQPYKGTYIGWWPYLAQIGLWVKSHKFDKAKEFGDEIFCALPEQYKSIEELKTGVFIRKSYDLLNATQDQAANEMIILQTALKKAAEQTEVARKASFAKTYKEAKMMNGVARVLPAQRDLVFTPHDNDKIKINIAAGATLEDVLQAIGGYIQGTFIS